MSTTQQPEALEADHSEQNLEMVARWYMIDKDGMAMLCTDREDAEKEAKKANMAWPHTAPHRAVQLVEAADVEALRTGYAAARLEIESLRARSVPVSEADMVLAAMETGEWELQRLLPQTCFTSEANIRNAWSVKRSSAPYCTKDGLRIWTGATPLEALRNGAAALGVELPGCSETAALPEPAGAMLGEQAELRRLSDCCPELNLSNYGPDDVDELNGWAIEVSQCIDRALAAQPATAQQPGAAYAAPEVLDALNWVDDFIARCNGDDRGACESVNVLRRAFASHWQAPAQAAPDVSGYVSEWSGGLCTSDEAMDGIAKLYAAQPAGAQQSDVAYAALPDADRDYMRKVVAVAVTMLFDGYKEDVTRVFSTGELSEFVTITAAMGGERVEGIYRRAWDLLSLPVRASHGQAPAQAAPQQEVQEPGWVLVPAEATDAMMAAFAKAADADVDWHNATESDRQDVRDGFCPAYRAMLRAAPQPSPASQGDALDAERYRWLRERMLGIDFDWNESGITALSFEMPDGCAYGGCCNQNIDAARARLESKP